MRGSGATEVASSAETPACALRSPHEYWTQEPEHQALKPWRPQALNQAPRPKTHNIRIIVIVIVMIMVISIGNTIDSIVIPKA